MVTKLLHAAGLQLGDDADLMPPADENPEGFYEHVGFVRLNDEVLNAAGAGWDCPPASGFDWDSPVLDPFRERARALAAPLAETPPWGWKDPRTSLTLPFWRSALGPLRTVVVIRNPLEVVTSLHRRNGFSIALSLTLWRLYAERIVEDSTLEQRLVTHYDAYFFEPEREIARLLRFLGLDSHQNLETLRAAAVPDLRHHRKTLPDLAKHGFPAEVISLYRDLCREAQWWEGDAQFPDAGDSPAARPNDQLSTIARGLGGVELLRVENEALRRNNADFTHALADRETRITELETALNLHQTARAELANAVRERNGILAERDAAIASRDATIATLNQRLADTAERLARLQEEVAALSDRLAERERDLQIAQVHERELRTMLTSLQAVQLERDAEIMGTLGAVLSRHAPGAPASIYYRRLVDQVRQLVAAHVPAGARTLSATYGDDALLDLGDRLTEPFPRSVSGIAANYTDIGGDDAVGQLESRRAEGAEFLVVPSPALPWLANHPELERHIETHYVAVTRERGVATIYALQPDGGQVPA
jgi:hypothetical protein